MTKKDEWTGVSSASTDQQRDMRVRHRIYQCRRSPSTQMRTYANTVNAHIVHIRTCIHTIQHTPWCTQLAYVSCQDRPAWRAGESTLYDSPRMRKHATRSPRFHKPAMLASSIVSAAKAHERVVYGRLVYRGPALLTAERRTAIHCLITGETGRLHCKPDYI